MLTLLVAIVIAALICWVMETYCKIGNPDPTHPDELTRDWQAIENELNGIKTGVTALGWNILWPLIPLLALVCLVIWTLYKPN